MRPLSVRSMLQEVAMHTTSASPSSSADHRAAPQSPWHSPIPYLFGGLAAMLALITFALLILACSYWRLSFSGAEDGQSGGAEDEEKESRSGDKAANGGYEEKFLVIMAGDNMPRFIATPAMKKCTCGVHEGKMVVSQEDNAVADEEKKIGENEAKVKDTGEPTTSH
ncbi:Protein GLUTAMINE DUMPER 1 [Raphanus sativus]|uniref:Protein GLUTAMINE DUMPER 1 n=1 Tax=Raphanus sativus TaxID=3726 RepID=A0A6J0LEG3_RAPSA|nr:protein GLUTAMINE DUMPER 1 [Raphanus sativus]KAJ4913659.1 Protein GLUTAMINE DUMPER 1 [Raphanus sativus]